MADAPGTRTYGWSVTVFSVGSKDFLGAWQNATLSWEFDVQNNQAVKDDAPYPIATHENWRLEWTAAGDKSGAWQDLVALNGTTVAVSITTSAGGTKNIALTGNGLLHMVTFNLPDGGQTINFAVTAQGGLTPTVGA